MDTVELSVHSRDRLVTDLTGEAQAFASGRGDGLLNVFVPHATAGVALIETGAGSEPDLADALERLLPTADIYRHRHGSLGHGRDHVLPDDVKDMATAVLSHRVLLQPEAELVGHTGADAIARALAAVPVPRGHHGS